MPGISYFPMINGVPVVEGILEASVATGESGPVIMLAGEVDLTCAAQLSALMTAQENILSRSLVPRRGRVTHASSRPAGVGVTPRLPFRQADRAGHR